MMLFHTGKLRLLTVATTMLASMSFISAASAAGPTYALVQINQQALFFNLMNKGAQDAAKASGKDLVIFNSNDNPVAQNDAIENYIQQGVKGILVAAIDVNGIMPAVKEAAAANIPVIAIDAVLPAGPQAAQVGVDKLAFVLLSSKTPGERCIARRSVLSVRCPRYGRCSPVSRWIRPAARMKPGWLSSTTKVLRNSR